MTDVEDRVERALHVLAERIEPDVVAARQRLGSRTGSSAPPARRLVRPRVWVTLAAATVLVVGIGAMWAVGPRPERPDPALSAPESVAATTGTVASTPTSSASVEGTTIEARRPVIREPERVVVLDQRSGVAPIRSDPVLDWVHGTSTSAPRRWFIRRAADGTPAGGVSVSDAGATQWWITFHDAPQAGIAGVDARIVVAPLTALVGWPTEDGARIVAGIGDVDAAETTAFARLAVSTDRVEDITVPEGFEEIAVPTDQGTVRYEDTQVTIGLSTVERDGDLDAAAVAFMTPGRDGPLSQLADRDAWQTTTFGGHPTVVISVDADAIATLVGLPGTDVESLAPALAVVPARQVAVANPETHGIPADATKTYGEIDRGRWVVYQYTTTAGHECISIDASWGGSGDCSPPGKSDCPVANLTGGPSTPSGFEVFVPYHVDDLGVALDGEQAAMTVEHAQGFTFAYGPVPTGNPAIEVTIDGQPAC